MQGNDKFYFFWKDGYNPITMWMDESFAKKSKELKDKLLNKTDER